MKSANIKMESRGVDTLDETLESVKGELHEAADSHEDPYLTNQQLTRDKKITNLLATYIQAYDKKVDTRQKYQSRLFETCIWIVWIFSLALVILVFLVFLCPSKSTVSGVTSVITAGLSFAALIVELLKIITKYCFPDNDEQYITEIVRAIQSNDLKNKELNIKNGQGHESKETNVDLERD